MADELHLQIFRKGVASWNQWRKENPEIVPDLSGADLTVDVKTDTPKARGDVLWRYRGPLVRSQLIRLMSRVLHLSHVDHPPWTTRIRRLVPYLLLKRRCERLEKRYEAVESSIPDERPCYLRGINLSGANVSHAHLSRAFLCEADISGADCTKANFIGADLRKSNLSNGSFNEARFDLADLSECDFTGSNFFRGQFNFASLKGVKFCKVSGNEANFDEADFGIENSAPINILERNMFTYRPVQANLREAGLAQATFRNAYLERADLRGAHLYGACFRTANLTNANMERSVLSNADLRGADLTEANLQGVGVFRVQYDRTTICNGIRLTNCFGSVRFERFAKDQSFLDELRHAGLAERILFYVWLIFADCGRSPWSWLVWCILIVGSFGFLYELGSTDPSPYLPALKSGDRTPFTPYYFSIVTFTTLGFGDVVPDNLSGELWVSAEVVLGYLMLGALISIVSALVTRRAS